MESLGLVNGILVEAPRFHLILFFTRSPGPSTLELISGEPKDRVESQDKFTVVFLGWCLGEWVGMGGGWGPEPLEHGLPACASEPREEQAECRVLGPMP